MQPPGWRCHVSSSVTGILTATDPLFTAVLALLLIRSEAVGRKRSRPVLRGWPALGAHGPDAAAPAGVAVKETRFGLDGLEGDHLTADGLTPESNADNGE